VLTRLARKIVETSSERYGSQPGQQAEDDRQLMETSKHGWPASRHGSHFIPPSCDWDWGLDSSNQGSPCAKNPLAGLTALFLLSVIYRTWEQTLALIELSDQP
jgi:hypothetical protein